MSLSFSLLTLAEVAAGLFLIWGFWHEDKVVAFENKILARLGIKRRHHRTAKITPFHSADGCTGHKKSCI